MSDPVFPDRVELDIIPRKFRAWTYRVLAAAIVVEQGLDAVGWGLVPESIQVKVLKLAAFLGLTMAAVYTPRKPDA